MIFDSKELAGFRQDFIRLQGLSAPGMFVPGVMQ